MPAFIDRFKQIRHSLTIARLPMICILWVVAQRSATAAPSIPAISVDQAPYSQLFFTGSEYAVKDADYNVNNSAIGVETVWSTNPTKQRSQVAVRYCLPNFRLTDDNPTGAALTKIVLLADQQSIVTINQRLAYTPTIARVIRPAQYQYPDLSDFYDPFILRTDVLGRPISNNFAFNLGNFPTGYLPEATCSYGTARFDITPVAATLAQAPAKTLQMQLVFSNGVSETWHLGSKTVQILKDLVQQKQTR